MGGATNPPRMDGFENFSNLHYTKLELKGGPFNEKHC
jgi:hypothetical protein